MNSRTLAIAAALILSGLLLIGYVTTPAPVGPETRPPGILEVSWEGEIGESLLKQATKDLETALSKNSVLRVRLYSPGGDVLHTIELSRRMRDARKAGLVIEIEGRSEVASGAVLILASGTPGKRSILRNSLVLLHGIQVFDFFMFSRSCIDSKVLEMPRGSQIGNFDPETSLVLHRIVEQYFAALQEVGLDAADVMSCSARAGGGGLAKAIRAADEVIP